LIIAIGNAPSSGSTLLADLLDSLPFAVCGPETRLFAVKGYYENFQRLKAEGFFSSRSPVIYEVRQRMLRDAPDTYGFKSERIHRCLKESNTFHDFCETFFQTYAGLRGKTCRLFFEKTPENIHCAKLFLDAFPDGIFLHVVRNPLYVYKSLVKRGFFPFIAANTWLIDEAAAYQLRNHERFFTIRYEDLIKKPFETVVDFLGTIGISFDPRELEVLYKNNTYRDQHIRRVTSWSVKRYGAIEDGNKKEIGSEDWKALRFMETTKVSHRYAGEFGLAECSFREMAGLNGYSVGDLLSRVKPTHHDETLRCDLSSCRLLLKKFVFDWVYGDCRLNSCLNYLKPVERCA